MKQFMMGWTCNPTDRVLLFKDAVSCAEVYTEMGR